MVDRKGKIEVRQQLLNFLCVLTDSSVVRSYISLGVHVFETDGLGYEPLIVLQSAVRRSDI